MTTGDGASTKTKPDPWDIGFGISLFLFALLAIVFWFPNDITGSFLERNNVGKWEPGDAFFPILLASAIAGLSAFYMLSLFLGGSAFAGTSSGGLSLENIKFFIAFHMIVFAGLGAMYSLGPLTTEIVNWATGSTLKYRNLVDTFPYKYAGYVVGACILTIPLVSWAEGRLRLRAVLIVFAVICVLILIFDILLRNVQLPPNANY